LFKVLEVDILSRKAATSSNQEISVTEENRATQIKTSTKMKYMEMKSQPGVAYNDTTPDGKAVIALVTLDGNTFVSEQTAEKNILNQTKWLGTFLTPAVKWPWKYYAPELVAFKYLRDCKKVQRFVVFRKQFVENP